MSGYTAIVAAVAGAAVAYSNGQEQKKSAQSAQQFAKANADRQAKMADEESNKMNKKSADTAGILAAAQHSGKSGVSGTMLTGPQGVDPNTLALGKSTLLGG